MNNNIFKIFLMVCFWGTLFSCEKEDSVNVKPVAAFKTNDIVIIEGNPVVFTDLSFDEDGSIVSWSWDFGDGTSSDEPSPVHTYASLGEFAVVLTVTDNGGEVNVNEYSKTISILEPSTATTNPTLLWDFEVPYKFNQSNIAVSDNGTVYFGNDGKSSDLSRGDYNFFAVKGGSLQWGYLTDEVVRSSPAIGDNGTVYFGDYNGDFFALNADGSTQWAATYKRFKYASPAIGADGTIYIGGGDKDNLLRAINPEDGSLKWEFEAAAKVRSTPAIDSEGVIYFTDYTTLYALNTDGTEKWRTEYGAYTACATVLVESAQVIYVSDRDKHLFAFNMEDGSIKWNNDYSASGKTELGGPAVAPDGTIYLGGEDNKMIAYNAEDGSAKWEFEAKGKIKAVPAIDNKGNLYFGDEAGYFYVISPEGETKWKETQLAGPVSTAAAIGNDGVIYVLSGADDNKAMLYAFKTNASGPAEGGWPMRSKNAANTGR